MADIEISYKTRISSDERLPGSPGVFIYTVKNTTNGKIKITNRAAQLIHNGNSPTNAIGLFNVRFVDSDNGAHVTFAPDDKFHNIPILEPQKSYTAIAGILDARTPSKGSHGEEVSPPSLNWSEWQVGVKFEYQAQGKEEVWADWSIPT